MLLKGTKKDTRLVAAARNLHMRSLATRENEACNAAHHTRETAQTLQCSRVSRGSCQRPELRRRRRPARWRQFVGSNVAAGAGGRVRRRGLKGGRDHQGWAGRTGQKLGRCGGHLFARKESLGPICDRGRNVTMPGGKCRLA